MADSYHHGNLKEELIKVGIEMINRDGVEGLSLRRAAEKCGVSHGAPYSHFKNKTEYLKAINSFVEDAFSSALLSAEGELTGMAQAYVRFFIENPAYYSFYMTYAGYSIDIKENSIESENSRPFEIFRSAAEKYLRQINVPENLIAVNIIKMWATVQGITMLAVMPGVTCDMAWEDYTDMLLNGKGGKR